MNNQIILGDCIEGMKGLNDGAFNLIIADPPYNLDKDFGPWKETEQRSGWKEWMREWLREALRVLSDRGNIFVYGIHHHQCWVQCMMYELGFDYRRQIIWHYENGFAGYGERSLSACYESLLWFSKTNDYIYHTIREPYKSQDRLKHKITKNGKVWTPHPEDAWQVTFGLFQPWLADDFGMRRLTIPHRSPYQFQPGSSGTFATPATRSLFPSLAAVPNALRLWLKAEAIWI